MNHCSFSLFSILITLCLPCSTLLASPMEDAVKNFKKSSEFLGLIKLQPEVKIKQHQIGTLIEPKIALTVISLDSKPDQSSDSLNSFFEDSEIYFVTLVGEKIISSIKTSHCALSYKN